MSNQNFEPNVGSLLSADEDDLYVQLGRELQGTPAFPPSRQQLRELARGWLGGKRKAIAAKVCSDDTVKRVATEDLSDQRVALVLAVADLISSLTLGVSPIIVSVLLVREGLTSLCADKWNNP